MTPTRPTQTSFAQAEYDKKKKRARREIFLAQMEHVIPWVRLMEVIEPHYPKAARTDAGYVGVDKREDMQARRWSPMDKKCNGTSPSAARRSKQ